MKTPVIYSADDIKNWSVQCESKTGLWTQARPISWPGLNIRKRLRAAWMVFTGRADALIWLGDEE
jgi:hypothetical protein